MAYAPPEPHDQLHADITDAVHHAVRLHPDPQRKVNYGKILAILLGDQARAHATSSAGQGGYGGQVAEQAAGPATPMMAMPPMQHQSMGGALPAEGEAMPYVQGGPSVLDVLRAHILGRV